MTHRMGKGLAARGLIRADDRVSEAQQYSAIQRSIRVLCANAARWPRTKVGAAMDYSAPTTGVVTGGGNGALAPKDNALAPKDKWTTVG
jgi:hypothetical protein